MRKRLTIGIVGAALAAALTAGRAQDAAQTTVYVPNYQRGPHIIHVPQADDRASVDDRDEPAISKSHDDGKVAPAPHPHTVPQRQGNTPAPDAHRAVLSTPPTLAEGPTPIRPLPRLGRNAGPAGKIGQSRDAKLIARRPPSTALPHAD